MTSFLRRSASFVQPLAGWLAVFTPVSILLGKAAPDIILSITAALFLIDSLRKRSFAWAREPWIMAALLLWGYGLLRTALAGLDANSMIVAFGWIRFVLFAAALSVWILPQEMWRKRLLWATFGVTIFLAADAVFQYVVGVDIIGKPKIEDRLTSVFRMPKVGINIAWLFFPVFAGLLQFKQNRLAIAYSALCFVAILLSGERFALLYTLCLFGLFALLDGRARKLVLFGGLALVAFLAFAMTALPELYNRQFQSILFTIAHISETHYGIIWASVGDMVKETPFFGVGVHHYRTACLDPQFGPAFVGPRGDVPRCVLHPHNIYLEWLVETGALGLALFLGFVVCVFRAFIQRYSAQKKHFLFLGLMLALLMRFWPLASTASFHIAWAVMSFWLFLGWGLSYDKKSSNTP